MVGLVAFIFAIENQQPVSLAIVGWSSPVLPVSVLVLLAFVLGALSGAVFLAGLRLRKGRVRSD
ncbi:lipopolysaccharide assembly protein LapA domain-containing protein [Pseudomonas putida]|uniref:lipopolysaccharide assembly protein LapA domain-containing protein n=1 Tax=Pseudomonas putida TaxID=303 RepID=UPI002116D90D|nr:lipopolysaccharide assembly protein LapA domain-containing protein [Pseudomonas putida]